MASQCSGPIGRATLSALLLPPYVRARMSNQQIFQQHGRARPPDSASTTSTCGGNMQYCDSRILVPRRD
eukprot:2703974-Amphidinium_carterae.2